MQEFYFLNDLEKELVEAFYKNEVQREAVKKVLLMGIHENGVLKPGKASDPTKNWALALTWSKEGPVLSDEQLGRNLRAVSEGILALQMGFNQLSKFKKEAAAPTKKNPAR